MAESYRDIKVTQTNTTGTQCVSHTKVQTDRDMKGDMYGSARGLTRL